MIIKFYQLLICLSVYSQSFCQANIDTSRRVEAIDAIIKVTDSIGQIKAEGIAEGPIKYNHSSRKFGWDAYFLNASDQQNRPLRIRYRESQPKAIESLDLYYEDGKLVFAQLITIPSARKLKKLIVTRRYYFDGHTLIYSDSADLEIDYILQKEKTIYKMVYE